MTLYRVANPGGIVDLDNDNVIEFNEIVAFEDEKRAEKALKAGLIKPVEIYTFSKAKAVKKEETVKKETVKKEEVKKEVTRKPATKKG